MGYFFMFFYKRKIYIRINRKYTKFLNFVIKKIMIDTLTFQHYYS